MSARTPYAKAAPRAAKAMYDLQGYVNGCGLEPGLLHLVKMRASQLNGCAYCLDMHGQDARAAGETEQRLYLLDAWREAPFYTDRERAALAWAEALTRLSESGASDEIYDEAVRQLGERTLVELSLAVVAINGWNRLSAGFRRPAGTYRPFGAE